MPITEPKRCFDQLDAHILFQRHRAEAEDGNTRAMTLDNMTFDNVHVGNNLHEMPLILRAGRSIRDCRRQFQPLPSEGVMRL
jgi:hypothetical protein